MQLNFSFLFGIILTAIGTSLIFYCWKQRKSGSDFLSDRNLSLGITSGWLLVFSSAVAFSHSKGFEFGLVYLFLFLAIFAWLITTFGNLKTSESNLVEHPYQNQIIGFRRTTRSVTTFLIAGPLAMTSSCLSSIFICSILPIQQANALVFAGFLFPLVWALAAFWICATPKRLIPTSTIAVSGIASCLLIFSI